MSFKSMFLILAGCSLASVSLSAGDTVELDPGLWSSHSTMSVQGQGTVHEETNQACISEAESKQSVSALIADLAEGDCDINEVSHVPGKAVLNMTCREAADQMTSTGTITVTYSSSAYTAKADATISGPMGQIQAQSVVKAKRIGECSL